MKFEATGRLPLAKTGQVMIGRVYDESTLLTLAHACQRAIGITHRPPLDPFLAKDRFSREKSSPKKTNTTPNNQSDPETGFSSTVSSRDIV